MKKLKGILSVGLLCFMLFPAMAQDDVKKDNGKEKRDKIEAHRVAFFTKKMELSTDEAEKFWPIYNEHQEKKKAIRKELKEAMKNAKSEEELSDSELEKIMQLRFETDQKLVDLDKAYHAKYKGAIGIKKTAKLYRTEVQFKKELLRMMKERKEGPNGSPRKGPPARG